MLDIRYDLESRTSLRTTPMTAPDLSIIIVNWNTRDLLADCLHSLDRTVNGLNYEVWVVDNASTDGSAEMMRAAFPGVHLVRNPENIGFARANNQAIRMSAGRYVLLLNSDAAATPDAVARLVRLANAHPRAGIVGARLLNPDGSFQASHTPFPGLWREFLILSGLGRFLHGQWYPSRGPEEERGSQPVDYVEGACLLVRRQAFNEVGGLDEGYFMYSEEVDWCCAMKRSGWEVWYEPQARIIHHGGASSRHRRTGREADLYRSRVRFFRKHYGAAQAAALKSMIYGLTFIKIVAHHLIRLATGDRRGRPVVSLRDLVSALREG